MSETLLPDARRSQIIAIIQTIVLLIACALAFWPEIRAVVGVATHNWEAAHLFAAPVLILILLHQRRRKLARHLTRGSVWGLVIVILALMICLLADWPFNYAYPRRLALVPAVGGSVLAVGGWRVLKLCLPMLLLLMVAIPTGSRYYAFLIIKPEQYTLEAVRTTLDALPGVLVDLSGLDLSYIDESGSGTIALGEPTRGASLLLPFLMICVFVTFARIRPLWQVVVMAVVALPVVLLANYFRLLIFGLVTIYTGAHPQSSVPRVSAAVLSLLFAYVVSVLLLWILGKVIVDERDSGQETGAGAVAHA